jgi:hypothetical protein
MLKNRGINLLVRLKVLESYLVHADPDSVPGYITHDLLIDVSRSERLVYAWIKNNENTEPYNEAEAIFETLPI